MIDGFSSGKYLAQHLHEAGCLLMHVASRDDYSQYYYRNFNHDIYTKNIAHSNLDDTLLTLSKFNPDFIVAGCEAGVLLADQLNNRLELSYCNDFDKTECRRNKFSMINTLHQNKVPAAQQIGSSEWTELETWLIESNLFPAVLKPIDSAGSDSVFICANIEECHYAFTRIKGKTNRLKSINEFVLAQEFLRGTEYVVNTVSLKGKRLLTELVQYKKRVLNCGNIVYDIDRILPSDHEVAAVLFAYIQQVHDALGIYNGATHAEVILTAHGPKLVEIAARSDGILRPDVSAKTTQLGQLKAVALSITEPAKFLELCSGKGYTLANQSYNVGLISPGKGVFNTTEFLNRLTKMSSYHAADFYMTENDSIQETYDVFSQPGTVYLVHPEIEMLDQDYAEIRRLESGGVYLKN